MPDFAGSIPFYYDRRGNRLEGWEATIVPQGGHLLWLRGPGEAVGQVCAAGPAYREWQLPTDPRGWTHVLHSPEPAVSGPVRSLLDLLGNVVTLPAPAAVDLALAVDWYKRPLDGVDPYSWPNSQAGELIYAGKYRYRDVPEQQRIAGRALAGLICQVIDAHPMLGSAELVLNVPGHDRQRVSFGSRLAATVAVRRGLPMVRTEARSPYRPESKNFDRAGRAHMLSGQFLVTDEVHGRRVLIVDDVIRSGDSMSAVAKAAREAGATTVSGICGARTMRG
jgi:pyrimidine operon attenuation protein/uracil phosphoribosyltransferase